MLRVKILSLLDFPVKLPEDYFEVRHEVTVSDLLPIISEFQPDVILCNNAASIISAYPFLMNRIMVLSQDLDVYTVLKNIEAKVIDRCWKSPQHPVVSIYTPTYNTGKYVKDAYVSLKQQTYPFWEWVIVDDGSDADTIAVLKEIEQQDCRVKVYLTRHRGNLGALKRDATHLCNGEYLIELDSDDLLTPDAVSQVKQAFDEHPDVGMVYSNYTFMNENKKPMVNCNHLSKTRTVSMYDTVVQEVVYEDITQLPLSEWVRNFYRTPHHLRAYRATELRRLGGYNDLLRMEDDTELIYKFFVGSKIMHLDKLLYFYRDTPLNITKSTLKLSRWIRDMEIQHFIPGLMRGDTCEHWLIKGGPDAS